MQDSLKHYPSSLPERSAVTLVAHGLNLKPLAMLPLVNWLASCGSEVYLIQLSGHDAKGKTMNEISLSTWQEEMLAGYEMARKASQNLSVPLFFLGYSLGALLGQSLMVLPSQTVFFDKQVLFAPAMALRRRSYLLKLLFVFGKQRTVPSYAPKQYRVNAALPLFVYEILFTEEKRVARAAAKNTSLPTLIFIDPRDELISYKRLRNQISRFALRNYRLIVLADRLKRKPRSYHHLIIDEHSLGEENWKIVTKEMRAFLFTQAG